MNQSALNAISGVYVSIFYVNLTEDRYYAVRLPKREDLMSFNRSGSFSGYLCRSVLDYVRQEDWPQVAQVCDRDRLLQWFPLISGHAEVEFRRNTSDGQPSSWLRLEILSLIHI